MPFLVSVFVEVAFILNPVTKEFAFICSYSLLYHILIKFLFVVFELRTFEVRRCRVQQSRANNHVRFFFCFIINLEVPGAQ
jgi:hypothetical protein